MTTLKISKWATAAAMVIVVSACGAETVASDETTASTLTQTESTTSSAETTTTTTAVTTTTSLAPTTTSTVTAEQPEAVPLDTVVGGTIRGTGWLVEPGRYTTDVAGRTITFTTQEPIIYHPSDIVLRFRPDTNSETLDSFFITEFVGVIPSDRVAEHASHDPVVPSYTASIPADLGTWLRSVSQLTVSDEIVLESDELRGGAWDIEMDGSNGGAFTCHFGTCIGSFVQEAEGVWVLFEDARFRIWQLKDEGEGLFGFLQSRAETFDEMTQLAEMILQDLTVEGSD